MSELTMCNYCSLEAIKHRAKKQGLVVTLLPERGGQAVYVHPSDVADFADKGDGEPNQYWRVWLMALTDHCVC